VTELERIIGALLAGEDMTLTDEDGAALAAVAQAEVDRGVSARAAAAARDGVTIACGRGCTGCCEEMILVYEGEAERAARWLELPENAAALAAFLERLPRWREAVGDAPARLAALVEAGDPAAYDAAHVSQWRRRVLCPFNGAEGECTIYPVRPVSCRNGHAVDTPAFCSGAAPPGKAAVRLSFPPLDEFLHRVNDLERAAHRAMGGRPRRPEALAEAVHRRLR
jgi:Fe-S-cluster containining protein